jgi:single-strand DNA-binding protein
MNKFCGVGRLAGDPEVRYSQGANSTCVARFSVAINRKFKNAEGNYEADFIRCTAFGKTGEFIEKYFRKGMAIGITGRITTGSYVNKDGQTVYTTEVTVEEAEFVEKKSENNGSTTTSTAANASDGFMNIPDGIEEELPFA